MTQKETILGHLRENGTISSWEAIQQYGITRLSAIIGFLKADGHKIDSKPKRANGKSYAEYSLQPKPNRQRFFELFQGV